MKISTKGRYALRLMLDLAFQGNTGWVGIRSIAERQGISEKYLEQIIPAFNHAGFVKSARGAQGGYQLAHLPEEYTVGMILRLTEGSLAPVPCLEDGIHPCDRQEGCGALKLWRLLDDAIKSVVDHVTLADLMEWQQEAGGSYII